MLRSIVEHGGGEGKGDMSEQAAWENQPVSSDAIRRQIFEHVESVFASLSVRQDERRFDAVERELIGMVFALGRLFLAFFLTLREERTAAKVARVHRRTHRATGRRKKTVGTFFGRVRFWRIQLRPASGKGFFPLDDLLSLTADGFSMVVMSLCARLATLVSFDQVTALLLEFLSWSPSKTTVEKAVLGFGRYTAEWFEQAPPPEGDGEILVIQIDSKATPTATDSELEKRRGKRDVRRRAPSPRHRGRAKRKRLGSKPRRKKGDKSKNGKAATIVVMYTLKCSTGKDGAPLLLGPLNRRVYASYAPKRHAFAIARREADKRGFTKGSGKTIQIVTDGDTDLEDYTRDFFPGAMHTLDIMHAIEYLWKARACLYKEGSRELALWVEEMKDLLYAGRTLKLINELGRKLDPLPRRGATNVSKRKRLDGIIGYLAIRRGMMRYDRLRREDYEIASGVVEGAVKHVIAKRFDNGSMRWIRERAEALLQLRCIEINGDWDSFLSFVENRLEARCRDQTAPRVLTNKSSPLPQLGLVA